MADHDPGGAASAYLDWYRADLALPGQYCEQTALSTSLVSMLNTHERQLVQLARTEIYRKGRGQLGVRRMLEKHIPLAGYSELERKRVAREILSKAIETV